MELNKLQWKIGGAAGQGVKSSGMIFAKTCTRIGLHAFGYTEYPSLIRGGHNTYQVRVEDKPIGTSLLRIDMLVALNRESVLLHKDELTPGGIIIYDGERVQITTQELGRSDLILCSIPSLRICREQKVADLMENQVFLGATFGLLGLDFKHLATVITDEFKGKGEQVVKENLSVAQAGYDHVLHRYEAFHHRLKPIEGQPKRMFLTGNDALSFGAIKAGLGFYVAYPMTPATSILHNLADLQHQYGYVVKHAEDEISVVNMAIGAGHAGVRSMCGTSGGGFALMSEGYSLAGITETPVVIVEAMRGGPATGLPTWTEQADLKFLLSAGHGEFPRFVLAPGDPEECYTMIGEAFNIAEEYQTPVIVAVDKHLAESNWSYPLFTQDVPIRRGPWASDAELSTLAGQGKRFKRYDFATTNGVSKRVVPGQHRNGIFLANSDEHDEYGYTTEEIEGRNAMSGKRLRKEASYAASMPAPALYGAKDAELTIVCWGSTKHAVLQALEWLQDEGRSVNVLHLTHLSPFPSAAVETILRKAKTVLDVELNATGQLADVIRMHTSYHIKEKLLKNDGRPMLPEEVVDKARALSHAKGVRA